MRTMRNDRNWLLWPIGFLSVVVLASFLLKDNDPQGFYAVLGLQPVRSVTISDIKAASERTVERLQEKLERRGCTSGTSPECSSFEEELSLAREATRVLTDPSLKRAYDSGQEVPKDYFSTLGATREYTLEQLRTAYAERSGKLKAAMEAERCSDSTKQGERCRELERELEEVEEAGRVLLDEASRQVYISQVDLGRKDSLTFVSDPLRMISSASNPLTYLAPILAALAVFYLIQKEYQQQDHFVPDQDAEDSADAGDEKKEKARSSSSKKGRKRR